MKKRRGGMTVGVPVIKTNNIKGIVHAESRPASPEDIKPNKTIFEIIRDIINTIINIITGLKNFYITLMVIFYLTVMLFVGYGFYLIVVQGLSLFNFLAGVYNNWVAPVIKVILDIVNFILGKKKRGPSFRMPNVGNDPIEIIFALLGIPPAEKDEDENCTN
jgi:hypothetical protein